MMQLRDTKLEGASNALPLSIVSKITCKGSPSHPNNRSLISFLLPNNHKGCANFHLWLSSTLVLEIARLPGESLKIDIA